MGRNIKNPIPRTAQRRAHRRNNRLQGSVNWASKRDAFGLYGTEYKKSRPTNGPAKGAPPEHRMRQSVHRATKRDTLGHYGTEYKKSRPTYSTGTGRFLSLACLFGNRPRHSERSLETLLSRRNRQPHSGGQRRDYAIVLAPSPGILKLAALWRETLNFSYAAAVRRPVIQQGKALTLTLSVREREQLKNPAFHRKGAVAVAGYFRALPTAGAR